MKYMYISMNFSLNNIYSVIGIIHVHLIAISSFYKWGMNEVFKSIAWHISIDKEKEEKRKKIQKKKKKRFAR